ncbi:UBC-like protein [Ceraceosorus guamensis]|uniref:Ubiquitin-conjugating enzyme E2 6 n=1 Tax=Ceraceosorus guamensis TaxID=1522189 RepID=A0A316VM36_9BASI|nr:UBC-like protein [Ceraceosorus guamensis]PWN38652.1 UBC-like protein [Ceraceosorus guamensis]
MSHASNKRLAKESQMINKDPPPFCYARPKEDNILEWHYILRGPPDCPYAGGEYWGVLLFPADYPFKPPGIKMYTPSGRFQINTKICMSMSDFHPGSWNPAWSVSTILTGLLSFMVSESPSEATTTGSMTATSSDRAKFASLSHKWNTQEKKFCAVFPEYSKEAVTDLPNMGQAMGGKLAIDPSVAQASESEAKGKDSSKVRSVNGQTKGSSSKKSAVPVPGAKDMKETGVATNGTAKAAEDPARARPLGFFSSYTNMAISLLLALFLARLFSKLT